MIATLSLPIIAPQHLVPSPFRLRAHSTPRLPRVERVLRKSPLLHAGPWPDCPDVLALNLAQGCAHRCAFCSVRAYPSYRGDGAIYLLEDAPAQLAAELAAQRRRPQAVYLSPSTDPFMPLAEVQTETARIVEVLARHGVEAWLMTRGYIRPAALEVLAKHRRHVKVTVGVTTVDRSLQRALEPLAAPPRLRLRQLAQLHELGIPVGVQLAPLVPGVTDQRANLTALLEALAGVGVRHVSAGYMFLRSGIRDNLAPVLKSHGWEEAVFSEFTGGPVLSAGGLMAARYLPRVRRQRGYAALMTLAASRGISVSVCGLTNPDFGPGLAKRLR